MQTVIHLSPNSAGDAAHFGGIIERTLAEHGNHDVDLHFAPGVYHFFADASAQRTLYISNTDSALFPQKPVGFALRHCQNITLQGNEGAVLFLMHGPLTAMVFQDCTNITLRGIVLDYALPSVVDLTVVAVQPGASPRLTFGYDPEWNCEASASHVRFWGDIGVASNKALMELDTRHVHAMCTQHYVAKTKRLTRTEAHALLAGAVQATADHGTLTIDYAEPPPFALGDALQLRDGKRDGCGIFAERVHGFAMQNMHIAFMYAFGVVAQCCTHVALADVRFKTLRAGRLSASAADMLQCVNCAGTITIQRCDFCNPHDDPVNIHGVFLRLTELQGNRAVLRFMHPQTLGYACVFPNDEVQFVDAESLLPVGAPCRVLQVEPPHAGDLQHTTLVLQTPPELPPGVPIACENITRRPRVQVQGCRFWQVPTRGLLVSTGRKILVENNWFQRCHMAAIFIASDAQNWYESGAVRNATIRGNVFRSNDAEALLVRPTVTKQEPGRSVHGKIAFVGNALNSTKGAVFHSVARVQWRANGRQKRQWASARPAKSQPHQTKA